MVLFDQGVEPDGMTARDQDHRASTYRARSAGAHVGVAIIVRPPE
jgi:hypothetical protein